jgi:hypothetical protein
MPWKIQSDSNPSGDEARIHFADLYADLHLVVDLQTGVTDLYIGAATPEEAAIYLEIDASEEKAIQVMGVRKPNPKQVGIIENVLNTLGAHHGVRYGVIRDVKIRAGLRGPREEAPLPEPEP